MKILLNILLIIIVFQNSEAQEVSNTSRNNWQLESAWHLGKVVKHRDYFKPEVTEPSFIYELSIQKQTESTDLWAGLYNCPLYGFSFSYIDIGDKNTLGQAIGLLPFINFRRRFNHINFNIKIGVGLAYFSKTFNSVNNYTNNAIGGHFTNYTRYEFGFNRSVHSRIDLNANLSFTHASNGNTEQPNLGLNFIAGKIGLAYKFYNKKPILKKVKAEYPKNIKTNILIGIGFNSVGVDNGPDYPVWTGSFFLEKKHALKGAITLGGDFEYYESVNRILVVSEHEDQDRFLASSKWMILAGYNFLFPKFSFHAQTGTYLYNPHVKRGDVVVKLNAYYHFSDQYQKQNIHPFIGVSLKSHYFSADYVQLLLGMKF